MLPCFPCLRNLFLAGSQDAIMRWARWPGFCRSRAPTLLTFYGSLSTPGYATAFRAVQQATVPIDRSIGLPRQPQPQLIFHRPLQMLLGTCFDAGFVLDGLEERAFPPEHPPGSSPLAWSGHFSEIPPVLVARMRLSIGQESAT